jgi:hypothetical protein
MVVNYHMICFTLFNLDEYNRFRMGWSFLLVLFIIILINIIYVVIGQINKLRLKKVVKRE